MKGYDEKYLQSCIDKAKKSWEGVDTDKFMNEIRGKEDAPNEELNKAAPDKIYVEISHPISPEYTEIIGFDTPEENTIKYIRADLAEQPEVDLEKELEQMEDEHGKELLYVCQKTAEREHRSGVREGRAQAEKELIPLINRLCEAILFEWKDAADLARKTLTQIKAREEE